MTLHDRRYKRARDKPFADVATEDLFIGVDSRRARVHPGEMLLEEVLKPLGISQSAFAIQPGGSFPRLNEVIPEKRSVTPTGEDYRTLLAALGAIEAFTAEAHVRHQRHIWPWQGWSLDRSGRLWRAGVSARTVTNQASG